MWGWAREYRWVGRLGQWAFFWNINIILSKVFTVVYTLSVGCSTIFDQMRMWRRNTKMHCCHCAAAFLGSIYPIIYFVWVILVAVALNNALKIFVKSAVVWEKSHYFASKANINVAFFWSFSKFSCPEETFGLKKKISKRIDFILWSNYMTTWIPIFYYTIFSFWEHCSTHQPQ